jgi:hypothetical protein
MNHFIRHPKKFNLCLFFYYNKNLFEGAGNGIPVLPGIVGRRGSGRRCVSNEWIYLNLYNYQYKRENRTEFSG